MFSRIQELEELDVGFVFEPDDSKTASINRQLVLDDITEIFSRNVDLVLEAANFQVFEDYAEKVLETNDMLILSLTALADKDLADKLAGTCQNNQTRVYVPHGAVLGMDGLQDARNLLTDVEIVTRKNPTNIDFSFTDEFAKGNITKETVLYNGPTRGVCSLFPRNVNAHAVVALAGIGFDRTRSILIADPESDAAKHHIIAKGKATQLEIKRSSAIKGVTGEYTLASVFGSIRRAATSQYGFNIM